MADLYLDDVRGYWRDLTKEAYDEFWRAYQDDVKVDSKRLLLLYRKLICAALFLNHQADKVAPLHLVDSGHAFIERVGTSNKGVALKLHACRNFINDAKHAMKLLQEARTRPREDEYDYPGSSEVLVIHMLSSDGELYDMCRVVGDSFRFWVGYFNGEGAVNFHQTLGQAKALGNV